MGIISTIRENMYKRKIEKNTQIEIEKLKKSLKEIDDNLTEEPNIKSMKKIDIIADFARMVKLGEIDLGENPETSQKDPISVLEKYFKDDPLIIDTIQETRRYRIISDIKEMIYENTIDLSKMESIVIDFMRKYEHSDRDTHLKPYSVREKYDMVIGFIDQADLDTYILSDSKRTIRILYENSVIRNINAVKDISEKERIFDEYIRDFLNGEENPEDHVMKYFEYSDFMVRRENARKCEKYGITYKGEPIPIYEATEEVKEAIDRENQERAEKRLLDDTITAKDLVLIRTTNEIPRYGIVETIDKHTEPIMGESIFNNEIRQLGLNPEDYKMASFISRRTTHWTLNGLVGSHEYGDFSSRDYIIIEPFEKHVDNKGLMCINEADTYFEEDIKLSEEAIILIPLERYKEIIQDSDKRDELEKHNIVLFTGDEKTAVEMILQKQGYIYADIGKWGFSSDRITPGEEFMGKLEEKMEEIASEKDVKYAETHFYSETMQIDLKRISKLNIDRMTGFIDYLAEKTDIPFSTRYLKSVFRSREDYYTDDNYRLYMDMYEEGPGLKRMSPMEVFEAIGPERIKELTVSYSQEMFEEHKKARIEKDKQLVENGLVTEQEVIKYDEEKE